MRHTAQPNTSGAGERLNQLKEEYASYLKGFNALGAVISEYVWENPQAVMRRIQDYQKFDGDTVGPKEYFHVHDVLKDVHATGIMNFTNTRSQNTPPRIDNLQVLELPPEVIKRAMGAMQSAMSGQEVEGSPSPVCIHVDNLAFDYLVGQRPKLYSTDPNGYFPDQLILTYPEWVHANAQANIDPVYRALLDKVQAAERAGSSDPIAEEELEQRHAWLNNLVQAFVLTHEATHALQQQMGTLYTPTGVYQEGGLDTVGGSMSVQDHYKRDHGLEQEADHVAFFNLLRRKNRLSLRDAGLVISGLMSHPTFGHKSAMYKALEYPERLRKVYQMDHLPEYEHFGGDFRTKGLANGRQLVEAVRVVGAELGYPEAPRMLYLPPQVLGHNPTDPTQYQAQGEVLFYVPKGPPSMIPSTATNPDSAEFKDYFYVLKDEPVKFGVYMDEYRHFRFISNISNKYQALGYTRETGPAIAAVQDAISRLQRAVRTRYPRLVDDPMVQEDI